MWKDKSNDVLYSAMLYLQIECRMKQDLEQYHCSEQWHLVLQINKNILTGIDDADYMLVNK